MTDRNNFVTLDVDSASGVAIDTSVLITVQSWFYGHDGLKYRAVWGKFKGVRTLTEDLRMPRHHANFAYCVGNVEIPACEATNIILNVPQPPSEVNDFMVDASLVRPDLGPVRRYVRPSEIYTAPDNPLALDWSGEGDGQSQ